MTGKIVSLLSSLKVMLVNIQVIIAFLQSVYVWVRLLRADKKYNLGISNVSKILWACLVFLGFMGIAWLINRFVYFPLRDYLKKHKESLTINLRVIGILPLFLFLLLLFIGVDIIIHNQIVSQARETISEERRGAKKVIAEHLQKGSTEKSQITKLPELRTLLEDVGTAVNGCANIRNDLIDKCHFLDTFKVEIEWYGSESINNYYFYGKCLQDANCKTNRSVLSTLHWADVPTLIFSNLITITNLSTDGKVLDFTINEEHKSGIDSPAKKYYIGAISGFSNNFAIKETVDWPCRLWRSPDGILVDTCKFQAGIKLLKVSIMTDSEFIYVPVFKFILENETKLLKSLELETILDKNNQRTIVRDGHDIRLLEWESAVPDINALYFFAIFKKNA